jgi:hypothetical protein
MRFTIPLETITVALLAQAAHADYGNVEVNIEVGPATGIGASEIRATVIGGPSLSLDRIRLVDDRGLSIGASSLREYKDGPEPIAVAFVIAGSEYMMGNDDMESPEAPSLMRGYNAALRKALLELDLAHAMPRGSQGMIVTYDDHARVRVPMGPISKLEPFGLGIQLDYHGLIGADLVDGIQVAMSDLEKVRTARKALIVIGDGNDTNNEVAKTTLAALKKRAVQEGIRTFALIYKSAVSAEGDVISRMIPTTQMVASPDGLVVALHSLAGRLADRTYVTFPGDQLRWDGKPQDLTIRLGDDNTDPVTVTLPDRRGHTTAGCLLGRWWLQLLMGLGAVGAIVLLLRWRGTRSAL